MNTEEPWRAQFDKLISCYVTIMIVKQKILAHGGELIFKFTNNILISCSEKCYLQFNPIALRTAKTPWSFGRSE